MIDTFVHDYHFWLYQALDDQRHDDFMLAPSFVISVVFVNNLMYTYIYIYISTDIFLPNLCCYVKFLYFFMSLYIFA